MKGTTITIPMGTTVPVRNRNEHQLRGRRTCVAPSHIWHTVDPYPALHSACDSGDLRSVTTRGAACPLRDDQNNHPQGAQHSDTPEVAFVVPVPRRLLPAFPPRAIQFLGTAEVLAADDEAALGAFASSWFLRRILRTEQRIVTEGGDLCFIRIRPERTVFTYGIGMSVLGQPETATAGNRPGGYARRPIMDGS